MTGKRMTVFVPISEAGYADFVATAVPACAADKVASGQWATDESLEPSRIAFAEWLRQGRHTADNCLFGIEDDRQRTVGTLWLAAKEQAGRRIDYLYDIGIQPEYRRRGHAARALAAAEAEARKLGLCGIALHVFGHNAGARALYETLGYTPTNIRLFKRL
jgi:ribosomal protein S18 acetylase RimI-like enzyme